MRALLAVTVGLLISANAWAFDAAKVAEDYYETRAMCRVADNLTPEQATEKCVELASLAKELTENGYCWDKSELVWNRCQ